MNLDLRAVLDPLLALAAARPRIRDIPAQTIAPPDPAVVGEEASGLPPVVIPARVEITPDPATLPPQVLADNGQPDLHKMLALTMAAVAQVTDRRVRVATGRTTLATGVYLAGQGVTLDVAFDTPALAVPESGWVQTQPAVAWLGRTRAVIVDGSITDVGCRIRVTALSPITPTALNPITFDVVAIYSYAPPFQEAP